MQDKPDKPQTHLSIRDLVLGGRLLPFSHKVGAIRKGDVFRLHLLPDGSVRKRTPLDQTEPAAAFTTFYAVTALKHNGGDPSVKMMNCLFKEKEGTPLDRFPGDVLTRTAQNPNDLAFHLGLPPAAMAAQQRGLGLPPRVEQAKTMTEVNSPNANPRLL